MAESSVPCPVRMMNTVSGASSLAAFIEAGQGPLQ